MVPEVAGLSVEEIEGIFDGPWYNSFRRSQSQASIEDCEVHVEEEKAGYVFSSS